MTEKVRSVRVYSRMPDGALTEDKDFMGLYEVSNLGNVYRVARPELPRLMLTASKVKNTYRVRMVGLSGKVVYRSVSMLVATAFLQPNNTHLHSHFEHIDGNPKNNSVKNLRIANDNSIYGASNKKGSASVKKRTKSVISQTATGEVYEYISTEVASAELGIPKTSISDCLNGRHMSSHGMMFQYGTLDDYCKGKLKFERPTRKSPEKIPVILFNCDSTVYGFYKSINSAAKAINTSASSVRCCIDGINLSVKGYIAVAGTQSQYADGVVSYPADRKHGKNFPVVKISFGGKVLAKYNSVKDAAEATGFKRQLILKCANHKSHSAYGFVWMFLDEWALYNTERR